MRLVKGAYLEPPDVAFPKKADVDENYYKLCVPHAAARTRRRRAALLHVATHDPADRAADHNYVDYHKVPKSAYEFAMLYGIQRGLQQRLAQSGRRIRVLIAYGEYWFPWYMRRLAERPANVWFVVKNMMAR